MAKTWNVPEEQIRISLDELSERKGLDAQQTGEIVKAIEKKKNNNKQQTKNKKITNNNGETANTKKNKKK